MTKKILFADDDPGVRDLVEPCLAPFFPDYEFQLFEDGAALEEKLKDGIEGVYAVITDHEMPGVNGFDIIKKYSSTLKVPFILYAGFGDSLGKRAIENGARAYHSKPDFMGLKDVLKDVLEN